MMTLGQRALGAISMMIHWVHSRGQAGRLPCGCYSPPLHLLEGRCGRQVFRRWYLPKALALAEGSDDVLAAFCGGYWVIFLSFLRWAELLPPPLPGCPASPSFFLQRHFFPAVGFVERLGGPKQWQEGRVGQLSKSGLLS